MTILSFILILCALGVAAFGISRIQDVTARQICFVVLIIITIFFLLIAAGVMGSAPMLFR